MFHFCWADACQGRMLGLKGTPLQQPRILGVVDEARHLHIHTNSCVVLSHAIVACVK